MNKSWEKLWGHRRALKIALVVLAVLLGLIMVIEVLRRGQPENTSSGRAATSSSSDAGSKTTPSSSTSTAQSKTQPQETQPAPEEAQPEPVPQEVQPEPASQEATQPQVVQPTVETATPSCWHYVSGRCYDDLEDEAAAAGYYDRLNGDYEGRSFDYPDDCDAECQDFLEEAYYDGYYDY